MQKRFLVLVLVMGLAPSVLASYLLLPTEQKLLSRDEYREKIEIDGLFSGRGTAGEEQGVPLVWFKLRNTGNQTVDEVRVHVNFLNEEGDIVHEEDFYPVHRGVYGVRVPPVGPGEVWQMSNIRYFMPSGVPHTWKVGSVTARVESVRFDGE
ncbi:MAG: hypothetical protein HWE25_00560 [Alphaproteobacteria bacterium]|nr:hypothetical protein [Alphaproteobacteria bacterium]